MGCQRLSIKGRKKKVKKGVSGGRRGRFQRPSIKGRKRKWRRAFRWEEGLLSATKYKRKKKKMKKGVRWEEGSLSAARYKRKKKKVKKGVPVRGRGIVHIWRRRRRRRGTYIHAYIYITMKNMKLMYIYDLGCHIVPWRWSALGVWVVVWVFWSIPGSSAAWSASWTFRRAQYSYKARSSSTFSVDVPFISVTKPRVGEAGHQGFEGWNTWSIPESLRCSCSVCAKAQ
jgi:hypothetical protein